MANAIVAGNYSKAYELLDILFYQNEEPIAILAVLATSYVDMYRVRACIQSGQAVSTLSQYFDYKGKEFKLKNAERDSAKSIYVSIERQFAIVIGYRCCIKKLPYG